MRNLCFLFKILVIYFLFQNKFVFASFENYGGYKDSIRFDTTKMKYEPTTFRKNDSNLTIFGAGTVSKDIDGDISATD